MAGKYYIFHSVRFEYIWFNILSVVKISITFVNTTDSGEISVIVKWSSYSSNKT